MRNRKILLLLTSLLLTLSLVACKSTTTTNTTTDTTKVVLILDKGGVNDGSFNESAYNGALTAKESFSNLDVAYLESTTDADYTSNIETAIDMKADLIIGVGFNLTEPIEKAAINYPNQKFAIVDGALTKDYDNVTNILFDEEQAGYLAGIATAFTIDSNSFGFIGGYEIPAVVKYRDGFEKGLKEINPKATLSTQYANSFTDAAKGKAIATQMFKSNIDCIMTAAGTVNNGVYESATELKKHTVAVDMAQSNMSTSIITSALKNVDKGIYDTINNLLNNNLTGGSVIFDMTNNGVGYEITDYIPEKAINYITTKTTNN